MLPFEWHEYHDADAQTRELMELELRREFRLNVGGLITAFIIAIAFLGVSTWIIASGHVTAGVLFGTVDLVALVGIFRYSANANTNQLPPGPPPPPQLPPGPAE